MNSSSNSRRYTLSLLMAFTAISVMLFSLPCLAQNSQSPLRLTVLDVKQGDSILIVTPSGKIILIDAADRTAQFKESGSVKTYYPAFDKILPYLEQHGIDHIDQFIISHPHADHIGGMADLLKNIEIREIVDSYKYSTNMYNEAVEIAREKGIKWTKVYRGDTLDWGDGIKTTVVHPPKDMHMSSRAFGFDEFDTRAALNLNNVSIVLMVEYGKIRYLLTGDAEKEAEEMIFTHYGDLRATALKAAHHGSKTSSSPGFLEKINPMYAFVSVGEVNKFKHPDTNFTLPNIEHYTTKNHGALFRTDQKGTIETWTFGEDLKIAVEKGENVFIDNPRVTSLLPTSVTIEWATSNPSTSEIILPGKKTVLNALTSKHIVTVTGLKPATTYKFEAISREQINGTKKISLSDSFATPAAGSANEAGISIQNLKMNPTAPFFSQKVTLSADIEGTSTGMTVSFHKDFVSDSTRLASSKVTSGMAKASWKTNFTGNFTLLAVLSKNNVPIMIQSTDAAIHAKKVLIDTYHWNMHTYKNELSSLKLDMTKNGFEISESKKILSTADLKECDLLIIPDPGKPAKKDDNSENAKASAPQFTAAEYNAVAAYVKAGGALLIACYSDFKGNQTISNKILLKAGAGFKFNDDTVIDSTHHGYERVLTLDKIASDIVGKDISQVLCSNSCSLVTPAGTALTREENGIRILTSGNSNNLNRDEDGQNNAYIYSKDTSIPISACQTLPGGGRIAAIGSAYQLSNSVYTHSTSHQTDLFNLRLVKWLSNSSAAILPFSEEREMNLLRVSSAADIESDERESMEELTMERIRDLTESGNYSGLNGILQKIADSNDINSYRGPVMKIMTLLTLHRMETGSNDEIETCMRLCRMILGQ